MSAINILSCTIGSSCMLLTLLSSCGKAPTRSSDEDVHWAGHALREVKSVHQLPASLQTALGVGKPGTDGIADRGGTYNSTDAIMFDWPMRRFVIAGLDGESALIAVEHGGIGWYVDVTLFSGINSPPRAQQTWDLFDSPKDLHDLAAHLATATSP